VDVGEGVAGDVGVIFDKGVFVAVGKTVPGLEEQAARRTKNSRDARRILLLYCHCPGETSRESRAAMVFSNSEIPQRELRL
jgi:hypothetical protein